MNKRKRCYKMKPILKDLCVLVRKSTIHYLDTCPQNDIELNNEFKDRYNSYLSTKNYTVEYSIMAEPVIPDSRATLIPVARAIYSIV